MADGQRHLLNAFSNPLSQNGASSDHIASGLFLNSLLTHLATSQPPSLSKNTAHGSASQNTRGMYGQNHQQGHNSRINGAPGRQQAMPMLYNFQQQSAHPHQAHAQHHQGIQQDHGGASIMGHSAYSSGVLPNASPFSSNLQNGHAPNSRGGQAQQLTEHWAEQLRLHKEAERAHATMTEQHQPHFYARLKAAENRGIGGAALTGETGPSADGEDDRRRPWSLEKTNKRQDWYNLDMSGQGLRVLAPPLFAYEFLQELYIASNRLTYLPAEIGKLRHLRHLDASNNLISELPPEVGMCTNLKSLYLFNNQIRDLPSELGSLYLLDMLGIEGNPLDPSQKQEIMAGDSKSLVNRLLLKAPGEHMA
jgi:CCR4-NOT transcription complex subunit 6